MQRVTERGPRGRAGVEAVASTRGEQSGRPHLMGFQRARLLNAAIDAAAEKGAANVTVTDILARAGISRRTFYELFADRWDCLRAAFEHALHSASERVLPAYRSGASWRLRLRSGLIGLLSFVEEEPKLAGLLLVESYTLAPVWPGRERVVATLVEAVDAGRGEGGGKQDPPALTAEGLVAGALSILARVANRPGGQDQRELVNSIMAMIVLPYLGAAAARRELNKPVEPVATPGRAAARTGGTDPFKQRGVRLTYRTLRTLAAIAEHPGASNRAIGDLAGIRDQGQVSKLMQRLKRLGLVEEDPRLTYARGAPNAWLLTAAGSEIADGVFAYSQPDDGSR